MNRRGFTLAELLVTLVLLALLLAVAPLPQIAHSPSSSWRDAVARTRHDAIRLGKPQATFHDSVGRVWAYPDGAVATDSVPYLMLGGTFDAP